MPFSVLQPKSFDALVDAITPSRKSFAAVATVPSQCYNRTATVPGPQYLTATIQQSLHCPTPAEQPTTTAQLELAATTARAGRSLACPSYASSYMHETSPYALVCMKRNHLWP